MTATVETQPPLDETARAILDAASRRFLHYGYGKTTMSEIAGDCNMSTGNIAIFRQARYR
ncbi:MAG: TetR family transcriptional regulator [Parvularculaceae bacterium]